MERHSRFEDQIPWQMARETCQRIYNITRARAFKDRGLRDQIQRAATSVMANFAEGYDSDTDREFIRFLRYARRSASEVQSHLWAALDQNYIDPVQFQLTYKKIKTTKHMLRGLIDKHSN